LQGIKALPGTPSWRTSRQLCPGVQPAMAHTKIAKPAQ
jgi:hypothetical protein